MTRHVDLVRRARRVWPIVALVAALALALSTAPSVAQPIETRAQEIADRLDYLDAAAVAVEALLDSDQAETMALGQLRETMSEHRAEARALAEELEADIAPLKAQLEALGPAPEDPAAEAVEIAQRRQALTNRIALEEGGFKRAILAAERADGLLTRLAQRQRAIFSERLLARGPSIIDTAAWGAALAEAPRLLVALGGGLVDAARSAGWVVSAGVALVLAALLFFVYATPQNPYRRLSTYLIDEAAGTHEPSRVIAIGLALVLLRAGPPVLIAYALALGAEEFADLAAPGRMFAARLAEGVAIVALTWAIARLLFAPRAPTQRIADLGDQGGSDAVFRMTALAALVSVGRLVLDTAAAAEAPLSFLTMAHMLGAALSAPLIYELARTLTAGALAGMGQSDAPSDDDGESPEAPEEGGVATALLSVGRGLGLLVALFAPASAALGYYPLSRFVLERACVTAALMIGVVIAYVAVRRLLEGPLAPDPQPGAMTAPASPPRKRALGLAPTMAALLLMLAAAPLMAAIWGASAADLRVLAVDLLDGVEIGDTTYSVVDLLIAASVFIIGVWVTRLLQRLLRRNVLPNTSLDSGVQTSLIAGLGYVGFFVTFLLSVSAAGLDLSNIALVAGALSVGIGFGLQNIVNNFVSGLILLVERPIKVGDWIVVGDQQGYVRRINVRSTEVETFDRASVIVPNSELIASPVTNWTHKNSTGRVIASVGVSYDSDPEEVTAILREVGSAHPMVLRYPAPFVYFKGFGDSSLDFELRMMIRDVNYMLSVHNDVNLAIFKRFREAGIEIPFPQRDLHIRYGASPDDGAPAVAATVPPQPAQRHSEIDVVADD